MEILIADDDTNLRNALVGLLEDRHNIHICEDGQSALEKLQSQHVDLVITDNVMPKLTGLELIKTAKAQFPRTFFLLMTAYASIQDAVRSVQNGAEDYIVKPFDLTDLQHRVNRIEKLVYARNSDDLRFKEIKGATRIIGVSKVSEQIRQFAKKVGKSLSAVLIFGKSGTGKEVLAKSIHEESERRENIFLAINCASLNENLLESELFGHEKGSFTGAVSAKSGCFELASGGTLFLDEVGELAPSLQAKLLRVLQEKEFYRVGGTKLIKSDVRVIAATNRDLKQMVDSGLFREDLYFRLNVVSYTLPSLSERREDIPVLAEHFLEVLCHKNGGSPIVLSPEFKLELQDYDFPGNIRELFNILERYLVLGGEFIDLVGERKSGPHNQAKISPTEFTPNLSISMPHQVHMLESALIQAALTETGNNQVKAAEKLGVSRGALQNKMRKFNIGMAEPKKSA